MMQFLILLGLVSVWFLFGFFVATKIARISNPFVVTGMTWFAGVAFYISTVNGLGYVLPILAVFWLSLLIMIAVIVWCYFLPSEPKKKDYPPRWVLVSVWILALAAGVAYARTNASDWDSLIHYPVPATILEGNFPVRDPFNPWNRYGYHYAGMLLAAATTALTGVELATSYAIQPLFSAGALVFFSAAIGYVLTRSWKGGLLVALIGCAGGGFHWLYGASVFRDLYSTYILGDPLNPDYQTVFRYVSYMFGSIRAQPIINTLEHRAVGMGVGALMASLYSTYALVQAATRRDRIIWMLFFVVFTSVLALTLETAYAVLFAGIIAMVALYKIVPMPKGTIPYLLGALFVSFTVVAFQGGVITESLTFKGYTSPSAFLLRTDGRYFYLPDESITFWELRFIRDAGFTLLLLPLTIFAAFRESKRMWLPVLIAGIALAHMLIPFVIWMPQLANGMDRVIHTGMGLSGMLIGWWLWQYFFQSDSLIRKKIGYGITLAMVLSTVMHLPTRIILPNMSLEHRSLIPKMHERSVEEIQLHEWVRENTTINDRLFFTQSSNRKNETHDPDFAYFSAFTGRFIVKHGFTFDPIMGKDEEISVIENNCSIDALRELLVSYVLVFTEEQNQWFTTYCDSSSFEAVYRQSGDTVYKVSL